MAGGMPSIEVDGIREVNNALRRLDTTAARELRKDWKAIGGRVAADVPGHSMTRQQRASGARPFTGAGDRDGPIVVLRNLSSAPFAVGAFMGARGRFGNYGWRSNSETTANLTRNFNRSKGGKAIYAMQGLGDGRPQFPAWIGNQHDAGDSPTVGEYGIPHAVDQAIDDNLDWIAAAVANRLNQVGKDLAA